MIDITKLFCQLDSLDPRINPLNESSIAIIGKPELLNRMLRRVEAFLSIMDDDHHNPIRKKAQGILFVIQEMRQNQNQQDEDER